MAYPALMAFLQSVLQIVYQKNNKINVLRSVTMDVNKALITAHEDLEEQ